MNEQTTRSAESSHQIAPQIAPLKFGVGQPVSRKEDPILLTGQGRYTDDLSMPGQAWAAVLRAPVAHGRIVRLDTEAARALPGVLAVYTAADMDAAGYKGFRCGLPLKSGDGTPLFAPSRPLMATDRVRFVGEAVAMAVAESEAAALDALEAIELEIEPLPAATDPAAAMAEGAAALHDDCPSNVCLDWRYGDGAAAEKAFAGAAHIARVRLENGRLAVAPMEPRAALGLWDAAAGRYVLHAGCQGAFGLRAGLAAQLDVKPEQVRVLVGHVGGSFGMKAAAYPEYIMVLHAAKALGRPVKWRDTRSDSFLSDLGGRATVIEGALALDSEGRFLAVRVHHLAAMGAWLSAMGPAMPSVNMQKNLPGPYATPVMEIRTTCVFTNTGPIGPYRGAGRPEANYVMERLIDQAVRETGHDPVAIRRRNLVAPEAIPYAAPSGLTYDSGDFGHLLEAGLARADWDGFAARRSESAARGMLRGRGLACYLEVTAPPGKEMGGIRFEADGRVSLVTGTLDYGQGHASAFAQVVGDRLGIPFELMDLVQGDSDQLIVGGGTGGSRSIMASGKALLAAADRVEENGRALAAHVLEAAIADIVFEADGLGGAAGHAGTGGFRIAGTDRFVGIMDLAAWLREAQAGGALPAGVPDSLDASLADDSPPMAFPNGCHVCELEIDPETGTVRIDRYTAVDDFGTVINPMLAEGQVHGGIVQGIGQCLTERMVYDGEGQLLSGSFMDYALPRADLVPRFDIAFHPVPATSNPLGAKGCGEAGVSGSLPAVMNAVNDALSSRGAGPVDMPATPERIWAALAGPRG